MGDGFYRSKDPTNSIKVLKEKSTKENNPENKENTRYTCIHTNTHKMVSNTAYNYNTASPLVYNNMG